MGEWFEGDLVVEYGGLYDSEGIDGKWEENERGELEEGGVVKEGGYEGRNIIME